VARGESLWVAQHLNNALCQMLVYLSMSWNGLRYFGDGIVIPIMLSTVANQHAAIGFQLTNEFFALH
jgi:hypothetical protein